MKYQNKETGAIIDVKSMITEGPWQAIQPANSVMDDETEKVAPVQQKKRKAVKKHE